MGGGKLSSSLGASLQHAGHLQVFSSRATAATFNTRAGKLWRFLEPKTRWWLQEDATQHRFLQTTVPEITFVEKF